MRIDSWLALSAAVLLLAAGVTRGIRLFKAEPGRGRWNLLLISLESGSAMALIAALVLAASAHGEWSPADLVQVTLGLALAVMGFHLELVLFPRLPYPRRNRIAEVGLFVDVVVLGLILTGVFVIEPGGPLLLCVERTALFYLQWVLRILGAGAVIVGGCTGLTLIFGWLPVQRKRSLRLPRRAVLHELLTQSQLLALLFLGSGLAVGIWWAWTTFGRPSNGDPRDVWMGITWLATVSSWLSWKLAEGAERWPAGLTVLAAAAAIFGLLAVPDLYRLLGL
jgi:hypothetical protein